MLIVRHPERYEVERAYALDLVLTEALGMPWTARAEARSDVLISAPELGEERTIAIADCLFGTPADTWLTARSLPSRPLARWDASESPLSPTLASDEVPVIFGAPLANGSFFEETENAIRLGVDIFGSVFFQITRYEELLSSERDEHERFPAAMSLARQEGFLLRPLADEYVEILWALIKRLWPTASRKPKVFTEHISHDVDSHLYAPKSTPAALRTAFGDLVRRQDPRLAIARTRSRTRNPNPRSNPYNTFELIMDLSERRGVRSAFNFIAGTTAPGRDGSYDISDPWVGELIKQLDARGHEVGLHPSYNTFQDPARILSERTALERVCEHLGIDQRPVGGRQHFLRWENPITWRGWEQAGLSYDSTLGFSHDPGFRCGTCTAYPVFDLLEQRVLRLRERPLIAMEMAIIDDQQLDEEEAVLAFLRLRACCKRFGGEFTLLWHNSRLATARERRIYSAVLLEQG